MVRANALFIVIVIALVIGLMSSGLVLYAFFYRLNFNHQLLYNKLERNANSAMNLLLADQNSEAYGEAVLMDLYGEENDSISLYKQRWGIFEVANVKAYSGKHSVGKSILYGYKQDAAVSVALYLTDLGRPLSLSGKTIIKGTTYLPEAGVKRAYIEGQSFQGNQLIQGGQLKSKNELPSLEVKIKKGLLNYLDTSAIKPDRLHVLKNIQEQDTLIRSFSDTMCLIHEHGAIHLSGKNLQGYIMVVSEKAVYVSSETILNDILVFAPYIHIQKGFKGSLQAFARDSLVLEESCILSYPSALGLLKVDFKTTQPYIKVGSDCVVEGVLFTDQEVFDLKQTLISISKDASIKGQVYANGFVDLKGVVYGSVLTNKFLLKTPSSVYENHLLNATIDYSELSPYYIGSGLLPSLQKKRVVKWLN